MKSMIRSMLQSGVESLSPANRKRLLTLLLEATPETDKFQMGLPTVQGLLETLYGNGFRPGTVIDIGAHVGDWTRMASRIFPEAQFELFDADPVNEERLRRTRESLPGRCRYAMTLLGPEGKAAVAFQQLGSGSSVLPELTSFERSSIQLPMRTLDSCLEDKPLRGPLLMKIDVQGFELEVLRGASRTLGEAELVILETSLLPYNEGAPLLAEVVAFLAERGFATLDFCGQWRRETDHMLFQTDVAFARLESPIRAKRKFWLHEP
jgi:FkbM family methyltransferase